MSSWPYSGDESKKRLVVVGCGPAGIAVVRALASEFRIAILEPKDYYEYTPGILRGFVQPNLLTDLQVDLAKVLDGFDSVTHVRGTVVNLASHSAEIRLVAESSDDETVEKCVSSQLPGARKVEVPFDYAVVATGSKYSGSGLWKVTGAPGEEACISLCGRKAGLAAAFSNLQSVQQQKGTAVVVGAGLVGVELAAELAHFMPDLKIMLVNRGQEILPSLPESAREYAQNWLESHGVELRLGQAVTGGQEIESLGIQGPSVVFPCAGVRMRNEFVAGLNCCDVHGAILVNHCMQVLCNEPLPNDVEETGSDVASTTEESKAQSASQSEDGTVDSQQARTFGHIFALGDCVTIEDCVALPREIYPAEAAAEVVVKNLREADRVQCLRTCNLHKLGLPLNELTICSLGPEDAVFVANGSVWATGWAAATMKAQIESTKMGQYRQELWGSLVWSLVPHW